MMNKKEIQRLKDLAKAMYMSGVTQKEISAQIGISQTGLCRWVRDNNWQQQRSAYNITRPQLVNKLLLAIDKLITQAAQNDDINISQLSDQLCKLSNTLTKLEANSKGLTVETVETFSRFTKWCSDRDDISVDLLKEITKFHNLYIVEQINL